MIYRSKKLVWLILGDGICILAVSLVGFLTHYGGIEGWRWLTTFLPVSIAWLVLAPWFGVYQEPFYRMPAQIWRPALAAFLSAPLAAWIRGGWLNSAVLPVFVLVLGLTDAFGFLVWRLIYSIVVSRKKQNG